jgi:3-deoxy-7-phosphoheptulonate synthase
VHYPDAAALKKTLNRLQTLPGIVTPSSIAHLSSRLKEVAQGKAFLLQAGDCAELFEDCREDKVEAKLRLILMMSLVVVWGARVPVVRVGRIAGQYGKPRSKDKEIVEVDGEKKEVLTFR